MCCIARTQRNAGACDWERGELPNPGVQATLLYVVPLAAMAASIFCMTNPVLFDADLIRRCDRAGPRYTSYPTAVQFSNAFGEEAYRQIAIESNERTPGQPLSVYVHVPFCASPCFYCGCNRVITRSRDRAAAYIARLRSEIELQAELFSRTRSVDQLHFGGGTPTFLEIEQLASLLGHLGNNFSLAAPADREYSIEIDPRTVTPESVRALAQLGFNRMSLGVQDFDPDVQAAVNRVQSKEQTLQVTDAAREAGVRSISFDLIYGLPRQTLEGFARTLDAVIDARPERLAVYAYAHMPQLFKAQKRISPDELPTPDMRLRLLGLTVERLTAAGYVYIGMDHFALPNDELVHDELVHAKRRRSLQRNFQGYSTHADQDLIGLGVSAIGKVGDSYSQNFKALPDYYAAIDAGHLPVQRGVRLTADDVIRRDVIQELMCHEMIDCAAIGRRYGVDFKRYFSQELERLQELQALGLTYVRTGCIGLTLAGRLLMRTVAMVFDAYNVQRPAETYSKVV
jgi:oxygen-independent coproporphyrinogen III oxidase